MAKIYQDMFGWRIQSRDGFQVSQVFPSEEAAQKYLVKRMMDFRDKALVVIEFMTLHASADSEIDMGFIYKAAHVANNECQNPHTDWREWVEKLFNVLVSSGEYKPGVVDRDREQASGNNSEQSK